MQDPYFGNSVVCLCSYDTKGAFGFVLNKPIPLTIAELLQQLPEVKEWHEEQNSQISLKETLEKRMFLRKPRQEKQKIALRMKAKMLYKNPSNCDSHERLNC